MSEKERTRRATQREASLQQLLYTREQTAKLLGDVSINYVRRLENLGLLKPIRPSRSPTGMVFHTAANVQKLIEEAADASADS